jgi:hypothetical protein
VGESPREAVEATLAAVAEQLADTKLTLKPGMVLRRKSGDRTDIIGTQTSKWNRAEVQARFEISACFESDRLGDWKKQRWPGRPPSVAKFDRLVDVLKLKFPGTPRQAGWDVVDPAARSTVASEAAAIIRSQALPWFDQMEDPTAALRRLVTESIHASLIYYAIASGEADAARRRVAEIANARESFATLLETVRRDGKPKAYRNVYEPIAWAAVECGLA